MELGTLLALAALGGALSLDRTALLQTMASRPLVGAALAGHVVGQPAVGLFAGVLLELLWLMDLPVGASVPPDETISGVLSGVFAAAAPEAWGLEARAACGVLLAVPAGFLGRWFDVGVRKWNGRLAEAAARSVETGGLGGLGRAHWTGALRFFVAGAAATAAGAWGGTWALVAGAQWVPGGTAEALELVAVLLPVLGAGAVLAGLGLRRHGILFGAGLLGGVLAGRGGPHWPGEAGWPWRR